MKRIHSGAWLEVDLGKVTENVRKLKAAAGPDVKVLAMVKGDGYGCGAEMISRAALEGGAERLGVTTVAEALSLRRSGLSCPIHLFGRPAEAELRAVVEEELIPSVCDLTFAQQLDSAAREWCRKNGAGETSRKDAETRREVKIHLNVDTGMGRIGILPSEIEVFLEGFASCPNLLLEGAFTHFPVADADPEFTREQVKVFGEVLRKIRDSGYPIPLVHVANSAALLNPAFRGTEGLFDMVRPGISVYGLYGSPAVSREVSLEEVVSFKARVVHVKRVSPGASVSYGREFIAARETIIATIAAGYADGVPFRLAGEGNVLIRGRRFPLAGRVTMDMIMVDAGDSANIRVGDEAVIIGRSGQVRITVAEVARKAGTIEHDIICGIGPRVPRVYIRDDQVVSVQRYALA